MSLIVIKGSAEQIRGLDDIVELLAEHDSARRDGDQWTITAHATDAAITTVQARGATVHVLMTSAEVEQHLNEVLAQIQGDPGGGG